MPYYCLLITYLTLCHYSTPIATDARLFALYVPFLPARYILLISAFDSYAPGSITSSAVY